MASRKMSAKAGPQAETAEPASIRNSGMEENLPAQAKASRKACRSLSATFSLQAYCTIPAPMDTGVLGMMRITG